jgi:hypothetical protein
VTRTVAALRDATAVERVFREAYGQAVATLISIFGRASERLEPLEVRGAEVVVGDAVNLVDLQMLFKDVLGALVVLPDNVADPNYAANRSEMSRAISQALRE